ncbi:MAG: deoxyribonuclease [Gaiellaceae bacterium]|nr:deoxyribonuclease [Gaiellaceae bacterium]
MLYGAHVSVAGGLANAIPRGVDRGCDAIQVFTQSSRQWRPTNHDPQMLVQFSSQAAEAGIAYTICHAIYFINLASLDDEIYSKSVDALTSTVRIAAQIGADVCFHVGSHRGHGLEATMPRIQAGLEAAFDVLGPDSWLLLENSAGAGDTIGRDIGELATVIGAAGHPRLGLCVDSCHIYVSGIDIREPDAVDALLDDIDDQVGIDRLRALHINDAAAPLGSNRDRHANMLEGELGERMGVFLSHPALQGLPAILETAGPEGKGSDRGEVDRLKRLHELGLLTRGR